MMMDGLLVRTPAPYPTESLLGYVLRVAEANGYDSTGYVWHVAGISQTQRERVGVPIEKLARVLGRAPGDLARYAYRAESETGRYSKILDQSLTGQLLIDLLRLRTPAFCFPCVQETGHVDAFWDLSAAQVCPNHGLEVLRACRDCGKPLTWSRPGLLRCRCGAALVATAEAPASTQVRELMGLIWARVHGTAIESLPNTTALPIKRLVAMPLWAMLEVLYRVGGLAEGARWPRWADWHSRMTGAAGILAHWPHHYYELLERHGQRELRKRPRAGTRHIAQFKEVYQGLFRIRSRRLDPHMQFLREEFDRFVQYRWKNELVWPGSEPAEGAEVRRTVQRQFSRQRWLNAVGPEPAGSDADLTVQAGTEDLTPAAAFTRKTIVLPPGWTDNIPLRDVARVVGLPVSILRHLRKTGAIPMTADRRWERAWYAEDVKALLNRGLDLGRERPNDAGLVPLRDLMRRRLRSVAARADIVTAVLNRELPVVGRNADDLGGLLLDRAKAEAFLLAKRREVDSGSYSYPDAATHTGLSRIVIPEAVRQGYLEPVSRDGQQLRVTAKSVERFNELYVSLALMAKRMGTNSLSLGEECRKAGITPVIELPRPGPMSKPQRVLTREDADLLMDALRKERRRRDERAAVRQSAEKCEKKLRAYLLRLELTGAPMPMHGGKPKRTAIARACGMPSRVFYEYPQLIQMLKAYE